MWDCITFSCGDPNPHTHDCIAPQLDSSTSETAAGAVRPLQRVKGNGAAGTLAKIPRYRSSAWSKYCIQVYTQALPQLCRAEKPYLVHSSFANIPLILVSPGDRPDHSALHLVCSSPTATAVVANGLSFRPLTGMLSSLHPLFLSAQDQDKATR